MDKKWAIKKITSCITVKTDLFYINKVNINWTSQHFALYVDMMHRYFLLQIYTKMKKTRWESFGRRLLKLTRRISPEVHIRFEREMMKKYDVKFDLGAKMLAIHMLQAIKFHLYSGVSVRFKKKLFLGLIFHIFFATCKIKFLKGFLLFL